MSSYKNENENNVQINPKILSLVYTALLIHNVNLMQIKDPCLSLADPQDEARLAYRI